MAQLEITDKDIATVERLYDHLLEGVDMSAELHSKYRELIAMMYDAVKSGKKSGKITERGWAGHFICADRCLFRRNTLIEKDDIKIVVSTVGNMWIDGKIETIGYNRYYETMVFHADKEDDRYHDADVSRGIDFNSDWSIDHPDADDKANVMHDNVVKEILEKIEKNELTNI